MDLTMCVCVCVLPCTFRGRGSSSWLKGCSNTTAASSFPDRGSFRTYSSNCSSVSKPRTGKKERTHKHTFSKMFHQIFISHTSVFISFISLLDLDACYSHSHPRGWSRLCQHTECYGQYFQYIRSNPEEEKSALKHARMLSVT